MEDILKKLRGAQVELYSIPIDGEDSLREIRKSISELIIKVHDHSSTAQTRELG